MKTKDILGILFCSAGATIGTIGYRLLGLEWYFGACVLLVIGAWFIWDAARDRKLRKLNGEIPGDWGDRHYISGASATDSFDDVGDHSDAS